MANTGMPLREPIKLLPVDMQGRRGGRLESSQRPLSPSTLHERLVGHAFAVTDDLEGRSGVWGEHSYARERGAAPHSRVRTLLLPRAPLAAQAASLTLVDAQSFPAARPAPPLDHPDDSDSNDDDATDAADWERIVLDAATTDARRRLAGAVVRLLAELRLRRLAVDRSRWRRAEFVRGAATRLRGALATATAGDSAWLHGALLAHLPRSQRTPYERVTGELRRVAPRLAARLAPDAPPPPPEPLDAVPPPLDAATPGPWLGWVSAGLERRDERWRRRLGALIHVRPLGGGSAGGGAPPERWCATRAHAVRSALVRLLQEAGSRPVVLAGFGAGAALAARLASARGVRGAVLLAPPLLTAEGPDEPPGEAPAAALLVAGGAAAATGRGAAAQMASGGGSRRLLLVAGADDALRLPRRHRLRLGLPQQALDAAIAEECARWIGEVCAEEEDARTEGRKRRVQNIYSVYKGGLLLIVAFHDCHVARNFYPYIVKRVLNRIIIIIKFVSPQNAPESPSSSTCRREPGRRRAAWCRACPAGPRWRCGPRAGAAPTSKPPISCACPSCSPTTYPTPPSRKRNGCESWPGPRGLRASS